MKRVKRLGLYTFLLCCIMLAVLLSGCSEDAPAADESSTASESVSDSVSESETDNGEPGGEDDPDGHVCKGESWEVESEATCTEDGKEVFKCSCGKSVKTKKIPALGHDEIAHEAQAVTCDEDGWDAYVTCTRCDHTTYAKIAALGHTKELCMAQAPTCTDIGWNEYEHCTREGCDYTTYVELPALGHDEVSHEAKAPTCDEVGFDAYVVCSRCDYTTRGEDKAALGHNLSTVPAQAPTCTEVGWNKHKVCSRCDYSTMVEKAALGHDPVAHNGQEATCLVQGWDAYETCSRCDHTTRGANYFADHRYNSDELCRWCSRVYGSQGLQYQTNGDGTCILTGIGDCTDTVLEVPYKSPDGDVVTSIGVGAFRDCTQLTKVKFNPRSNGVTKIAAGAFDGCTSLIEFEASAKITTVGKDAFAGCTALLKTENGVSYVNSWVVDANTALSTVEISATATLIADGALENCTALTALTVPANIKYIGFGAFRGCSSLASITLPFVGATAEGTENRHFGYVFGAASYLGNADVHPSVLKTVTLTNAKAIPANAFNGCKVLTTVNVNEAVDSFGAYAFAGCSKLTALNVTLGAITEIPQGLLEGCAAIESLFEIPSAVTAIGDAAFSGCAKLAALTFASDCQLATIGDSAFEKCEVLASITLPTGVTSIGAGAFNGCKKLEVIEFPASVTSIGKGALVGCTALTEITVASGNEVYKASGNCLIELATKTLLAGCQASVIPTDGSVTVIGDEAFSGQTSLTAIAIPDGIVSIGAYAFNGCNKPTSVEIPASVVSIGDYAFYKCTKVASVTFAADGALTTIGEYAFGGITATNFKTFTVPASVVTLGAHVLDGCTAITTVTFAKDSEGKNALTTIGAYAFNGCSKLTAIKITAGVTSIGGGAFGNCTKLVDFSVEEGNTLYKVVGEKDGLIEIQTKTLLAGCKNTVIPTDGAVVTVIGASAFSKRTDLTAITIPDNITAIGPDAFSGCTNNAFTSLTIPYSVVSIGASAFDGCTKLASLTFGVVDGSSHLTVIGDKAFNSCRVIAGTVTIPAGVKTVGNEAFNGCRKITKVVFSADSEGNGQLTSIGDSAFDTCQVLAEVTFAGKTPLVSVGSLAFSGCKVLKSIVLPASVRTIGYAAFEDCEALTSMTLPFVGGSANGAESSEFLYIFGEEIPATGLTQLTVLGGDRIAKDAFAGCSTLTSLTISGVNAIEAGALDGCTALTKLVISDVNTIEAGALSACTALTSLSVPFVGENASGTGKTYFGAIFGGDDNTCIPATLTTVTVTGGEQIAASAFEGCANIASLTLPETLLGIGNYAFRGCTGLDEITIPASVTSVGMAIFANCPSLDTMKVAAGSTNYKAVNGCLIDLTTNTLVAGCNSSVIPNDGSVTAIAAGAFEDCKGLTSVVIPNSVTSIGYGAFKGCTSLTSITVPFVGNTEYAYFGYIFATENTAIPETLTTVTVTGGEQIAAGAFEGCANVVSLTLPETLLGIGNYAFRGCAKLTAIAIPASVTSVGTAIFTNCASLASITVVDENVNYKAVGNCLIELSTGTLVAGCNTSVISNDGSVIAIASGAFEGCTGLTSIVIPNSVTSIGYGAFKGCTSLTSITVPFVGNTEYAYFGYIFATENAAIPATLTTVTVTGGEQIAASAFEGCANIASLTLPETLLGIGNYAFRGCEKLTAIAIPASVTSVGAGVFANCPSLASITVASENAKYTAVNNCLIELATKTLVAGCNASVLPVDGSVVAIGAYAFEGTGIVSIAIPECITSIGFGAFKGCVSLAEITLPYIGNGANKLYLGYIFGAETAGENAEFVPASLKTVTLTAGTSIAKDAFAGCSNLTGVILPTSITSIGENAFGGCTKLSSVNVEALTALTSIGTGAFADCVALSAIVIPDSVTSIGFGAFCGCESLASIKLPFVGNVKNGNANTHFGYIFGASDNSLVPATLKNVTVTGGNSIAAAAFKGCASITEIVIPDSVTSIGFGAFEGCSALTSITLPFVGGIKNSDTNAHFAYVFGATFYYYSESYVPATLTDVVITGGDRVVSYAFWDCDMLVSIVLPDSLETIGYGALYGCNTLQRLTIPFIGNTPNGNETTYFGYIFGAWKVEAQSSYVPATLTEVTVTGGVLKAGAFVNCNQIETLNVGALEIVSGAFDGIDNLGGIVLIEGVEAIGDGAFANSALTEITIPASVTTIGKNAFYGCSSLTSVIFADGSLLTSIGESAFASSGLTAITLPASVTTIGKNAFCGCTSLTSVIFADGSLLTSIGESAFASSGLTAFTVPATVISMDAFAFADCESLASVSFAADSILATIGEGAFRGCKLLGEIAIPASVTTLGNSVLEGCEGLLTLTFDDNAQLSVIGNRAFADCASLTAIKIPSSVTSIGAGTFNGCASLVTIEGNLVGENYALINGCLIETDAESGTVTLIRGNDTTVIPNDLGITHIANGAFKNCTGLTSVTIPATVVSIGNEAFMGCSALASLTFEANSVLAVIGESAFEDCIITSVSIPAGVTVIGNRAFYKCTKLATLTFSDTSVLETIGAEAFSRCTSLTEIKLPASLVSIGKDAFRYCTKLKNVTFAEKSGWTRNKGAGDEAVTGLDDTTTAAGLLKDKDYVWTRTVASN